MAAAQICDSDACRSNPVAIPLERRAATNNSTCSVLTEKNELPNVADRDDLLRKVGDDDSTIETTSIKTTSSSPSIYDQSCSLPQVPSQAGNDTEYSMFQYFYETVAIGAETVVAAACSKLDESKETSSKNPNISETKMMVKSAGAGVNYESSPKTTISRQLSDVSAISQQTIPPASTSDPVHEKTTAECFEFQPDESYCEKNVEGFEIQPEKCCGISHAIMWSNNDLIGNTVNIRSEVLNILGATFSGESESMDIGQSMIVNKISTTNNESLRVDHLLKEIDTIGSSLSTDKDDQDRLIEKLVIVKQHLLEINDLLKSAPDDDKAEYFRVILRTAAFNAEVETRRAELELEKIRLESMQLENRDYVGGGNFLDQIWKFTWKKMSLRR